LIKNLLIILTISCFSFAVFANGKYMADPPPPVYIDQLKLPPGFKITIFARIPFVRQLDMAEDGMIYTGSSHHEGNNAVYAIQPSKDFSHVEKMYKLVEGLDAPIGVAYYNHDLYIGEQFQIRKIPNITGHWDHPANVEVVLDNTPPPQDHFSHSRKYIKFGPDGRLYFQVGDPVDSSQSDDPIIHSILSIKPDGSDLQIYAHGIRNTVGFDWQPDTNTFWFTDNGQDHLGDTYPPDEINYAPQSGMDFGFPCYIGNNDPSPNNYSNCPPVSTVTPPAYLLDAHAAPLGLMFYKGEQFPTEYKNNMFIAQHGSSIREDQLVGYNVLRAVIDKSKIVKAEPFITGWANGSTFWGRPVDVIELPDGSLLIADDYSGTIYRVTYNMNNH
jgi:glucose/arabinose dehydrogenase